MSKKQLFVDSVLSDILNNAKTEMNATQDDVKSNIKILPELKNLIPPLTEEEFEQLRLNILAEGCKDTLVVAKLDNDYILVDGHNRYKICAENKIFFKVELKDFQNIDAIKEWMILNQLGKRNLTDLQKSYLRGLQYHREKKKEAFKSNLKQFTEVDKLSTTAEKSDLSEVDKLSTLVEKSDLSVVDNLSTTDKPLINSFEKTVEKLALQHQVSAKTIQRDEKFALGLDMLASEDSTLKNKILSKEIKVPAGFIQKLADAEEDKNAKKILLKEFKNKYLDNQKSKTTSVSELEIAKKMLMHKIKQISSIEMIDKLLAEIDK